MHTRNPLFGLALLLVGLAAAGARVATAADNPVVNAPQAVAPLDPSPAGTTPASALPWVPPQPPLPEAGAAAAATPAVVPAPAAVASSRLSGQIEAGGGKSILTNGNQNWYDAYAKGVLQFPAQGGVLQWELDQQRHFGSSGTLATVSYTWNLSPLWYAMAGLSYGSADFMTRNRVDLAIYHKWLERQQLVTGLHAMWSRNGDGVHSDRALQATASYYVADAPLVAETGVLANQSQPGAVTTWRGFGALTYGRDKQRYLTLRYDTGREGYLPIGVLQGDHVDFHSDVLTVSWREWVTRNSGFVLSAERYRNPYYHRSGVLAGWFVDF